MTLRHVADQIAALAVTELAQLGLTVVMDPSDDPSLEDHSIEFRDTSGRTHAVRVQVDSNSPSLANSSLSIEHVELKPIEGTRYSCAGSGWAHAGLARASTERTVEQIITAIKANNWFVAVDDLEAGILCDFRWKTVIPKLRENFFDGEARLSRSASGSPVDTVEILHDGEVTAKAVFVGQAVIRVSYPTLAGDERLLEYVGLNKFQENIDKDVGGNPSPATASGPQV
jgi:hypothetical protein